MAILFLLDQSAQVTPAKRTMANRFGILSPPLAQCPLHISHEVGHSPHSKLSRTPHQSTRAIEQRKKMWSTSSTCPQSTQRQLPFQPLRCKAVAVCNLSLSSCQRKILIFKGILAFHMLSVFLTLTPLWVRKEYSDLVVKHFDLSKAHSTSSPPSDKLHVCSTLIRQS